MAFRDYIVVIIQIIAVIAPFIVAWYAYHLGAKKERRQRELKKWRLLDVIISDLSLRRKHLERLNEKIKEKEYKPVGLRIIEKSILSEFYQLIVSSPGFRKIYESIEYVYSSLEQLNGYILQLAQVKAKGIQVTDNMIEFRQYSFHLEDTNNRFENLKSQLESLAQTHDLTKFEGIDVELEEKMQE
ncbi:MAG TPA: hypothetical protein ENO07_00910 [candidate division Zixibacteria bacterium]|nr:hypothetical protein [candidate division Zixibacteria bacterium]